MSLLIRRIVLVVITAVLPLHGWGAALAACKMPATIEQPAAEHCCAEMQQCDSGDTQADIQKTQHDASSDIPCQLKPGCAASALYQMTAPTTSLPATTLAKPAFADFIPQLLTANRPSLWRPPTLS